MQQSFDAYNGLVMFRFLAIFAVMLGGGIALADQPATRPAVNDPSEIRRELLLLGDSDSAKRLQARQNLMALKRTDLPALRQAVRESLPLNPSQKAVLKDIVTQVYLAGDPYMAEDDGFLGVRLPNWSRPEERPLLSLERGVAVVSRIPGFCAFRMLQDGDVLLSIVGRPDGEINSPDQLIDAVRGARAGEKLTFEVLRQGQIIKITITLDRKPIGLGGQTLDEFMNSRAERADALWEKDFAPLLGETVG